MVKVKLQGLPDDVRDMISQLKNYFRICFCSDLKTCPESEYVRCYMDVIPYDS